MNRVGDIEHFQTALQDGIKQAVLEDCPIDHVAALNLGDDLGLSHQPR